MAHSHAYIYAPGPSREAPKPSAVSFTTPPEELAAQQRQLADPDVLRDAISRLAVSTARATDESVPGILAKPPETEVDNR